MWRCGKVKHRSVNVQRPVNLDKSHPITIVIAFTNYRLITRWFMETANPD